MDAIIKISSGKSFVKNIFEQHNIGTNYFHIFGTKSSHLTVFFVMARHHSVLTAHCTSYTCSALQMAYIFLRNRDITSVQPK